MSEQRWRAPWPPVVIASGCALCAMLLTGAGLLTPGESRGPAARYIAVGIALGAVAVLVRLEGPARASARLVTVAVVASIVAIATFPASPVGFTFNDESIAPGLPDGDAPVPGETGVGGAGGGGGGAPSTSGVLRLPADVGVGIVDGTVMLELPSGGRVVLGDATVTAPGDALSGNATVVIADGEATRDDGAPVGVGVGVGGLTLTDGDGGRVVVVDGDLFDVPDPLDPDESVEPPDHTDALLAVLLAAFALLAFAPPLVRFGERLGVTLIEPAPLPLEPTPVERTVSMEEGLAEVLRSMLADPDPRTAVIGAYARLLRALAEAGHPRQDQEGPHEHLWRILGPLGVRRAPVHQLAELFVRARFTPKPITEVHRQRAIGALADAVADLRLRSAEVSTVDDVDGLIGADA